MGLHTALLHVDGLIEVVRNLPIAPDLPFLQGAVEGYIETVPYFASFEYLGKRYPAVAFCNELGKLNGMEVNVPATIMWDASLHVDHDGMEGFDVLVGRVIVIFADDAAELECL